MTNDIDPAPDLPLDAPVSTAGLDPAHRETLKGVIARGVERIEASAAFGAVKGYKAYGSPHRYPVRFIVTTPQGNMRAILTTPTADHDGVKIVR